MLLYIHLLENFHLCYWRYPLPNISSQCKSTSFELSVGVYTSDGVLCMMTVSPT